jgi:hypothetical protein
MTRRTKPSHAPTSAQRQLVQLHATIGTQQHVIASILGIDAKTLRKHYREELDHAMAQANATIGGALFNKAKSGDTAAMIFWMKTRARWQERHEVDHTSSDGSMTPAPAFSAIEALTRRLDAIAERSAASGKPE